MPELQTTRSPIEPYFRPKPITLKDLEARHIQQFYSEKLKTVKPNSVIHYHAVIHQALKYAMKTDLVLRQQKQAARQVHIHRTPRKGKQAKGRSGACENPQRL